MFKVGQKYKFLQGSTSTWTRDANYEVLGLVGLNPYRPVFSSNHGRMVDEKYSWDFRAALDVSNQYWKLVSNNRTKNLPAWW
jgi:hypothetical protein